MSTTSTPSTTSTTAADRPTRGQRAGLVILALLGVANVLSTPLPSTWNDTPSGEVGPPLSILLLDGVLGLLALVGVVAAWRGRRWGGRVAVGTMVLATITALPAFFVPVPAFVKLAVGVVTLLTVLATVLVFTPARRGADG